MDEIIEVVGMDDQTQRTFLDLNRKLRRDFLEISMRKYNPQGCRCLAEVR